MQINSSAFPVGSRIRIAASVVVYHHPEHRNQPFDIKGEEGEIVQVLQAWHGRPVSANFPYIVKFSKRFKAHLQEVEIELA
jgi:Ferredoxin thioredoxin reductase variable alpha chain